MHFIIESNQRIESTLVDGDAILHIISPSRMVLCIFVYVCYTAADFGVTYGTVRTYLPTYLCHISIPDAKKELPLHREV